MAQTDFIYETREKIKSIWNHLTDEEIDAREDFRDVFFIAIKRKHGIPRAQAQTILEDLETA